MDDERSVKNLPALSGIVPHHLSIDFFKTDTYL
jgi:hypothetical protein